MLTSGGLRTCTEGDPAVAALHFYCALTCGQMACAVVGSRNQVLPTLLPNMCPPTPPLSLRTPQPPVPGAFLHHTAPLPAKNASQDPSARNDDAGPVPVPQRPWASHLDSWRHLIDTRPFIGRTSGHTTLLPRTCLGDRAHFGTRCVPVDVSLLNPLLPPSMELGAKSTPTCLRHRGTPHPTPL